MFLNEEELEEGEVVSSDEEEQKGEPVGESTTAEARQPSPISPSQGHAALKRPAPDEARAAEPKVCSRLCCFTLKANTLIFF